MEEGLGARVNPAVTKDLLSYISEFLKYHDFPKAAAYLEEERDSKISTLSSSCGIRPSGKDRREKLKLDMVRSPITIGELQHGRWRQISSCKCRLIFMSDQFHAWQLPPCRYVISMKESGTFAFRPSSNMSLPQHKILTPPP